MKNYKIPVNEMVSYGDMVKFETNNYSDTLCFGIRCLSFTKIKPEDIDFPKHNYRDVVPAEGVLWLLKIEVINFENNSFNSFLIKDKIALFDQDDFMFLAVKESHMTCFSLYSKATGLNRFSRNSRDSLLLPQSTISGALAFLLPDDDQAKYYLSVIDGSIQAL